MPANRLSSALTSAYRERFKQIGATVEAQARLAWRRIPQGDVDEGFESWLSTMTSVLAAAQGEAARASAGYMEAFLVAELGGEPVGPSVDVGQFVGISRDGRPLRDALASPIIGAKAALRDGDLTRALRVGLTRATRLVSLEIDYAAQTPLLEGIEADDRFDGWQRAVRGTCGACLGAARGPEGGLRFSRHPHCQCVAEPRVAGVADRFRRPTGDELFAAMTRAQQDAAVGAVVAELIRSDEIALTALVAISPQATTDDFITQAPTASVDPAAA